MDINLNWIETLQVYASDDGLWVYDPSSGQIYQYNGFGYMPVGTAQLGASSPDYSFPNFPSSGPVIFNPRPQPPIWVTPPNPGSVWPGGQPSSPVTQPNPVPRVSTVPPIIVQAPPPWTGPLPPRQGSGTYVTPPQPGSVKPQAPPPVSGSGGTIRNKAEPNPQQGYWEIREGGSKGRWVDYPSKKFFKNFNLPANKVRYKDGRPWEFGRLAVYGSDEQAFKGVYYLLYDNPNTELRPYNETILAIQIIPVLPF